MRTSVFAGWMRCNRPAYCTSVPFHDTGIARKSDVEACVVEPLADVSTGGEHETLLVVRNPGELLADSSSLLCGHAAPQDDQVTNEAPQAFGQVLEMIPPLGSAST